MTDLSDQPPSTSAAPASEPLSPPPSTAERAARPAAASAARPAVESPSLGLFWDAAYFDKLCASELSERSNGKPVPLKLDYRKLPALLAGRRPWRSFYYYALPYLSDPPLPAEHAAHAGKKRFIELLASFKGYVPREGRVERRGEQYVQKRLDVMLAVDLVRLAWTGKIGHAVVIAGDSDFVPAIASAREAGVHVTLRYVPGTAHADLIAACDAAVPLTRAELASLKLGAPPSA